MSPYVVTTKQRAHDPLHEFGEWERVSRRAVATLDEALEHAADLTQSADLDTADRLLNALPESGGTVGPLPDGTVIEVERVTWMHLGMHTAHPGWSGQLADDQILAAFNAAQEATR